MGRLKKNSIFKISEGLKAVKKSGIVNKSAVKKSKMCLGAFGDLRIIGLKD